MAALSTNCGSAVAVEHEAGRARIQLRQRDARQGARPVAVAVAGHPDHQAAPAARGQVVDLAGRHQTAVVDDHDRLAQVLHQVELMTGEQHALARPGLAGEHLAHRVDAGRVKAGERLVEDEQVRVVHERGGELDALLVALRQGLDLVPGPVGDAEPLQPRCRAGRRGSRSHLVQSAQVLDLLADAHAGIEPAFLGQVAEPPALVPA